MAKGPWPLRLSRRLRATWTRRPRARGAAARGYHTSGLQPFRSRDRRGARAGPAGEPGASFTLLGGLTGIAPVPDHDLDLDGVGQVSGNFCSGTGGIIGSSCRVLHHRFEMMVLFGGSRPSSAWSCSAVAPPQGERELRPPFTTTASCGVHCAPEARRRRARAPANAGAEEVNRDEGPPRMNTSSSSPSGGRRRRGLWASRSSCAGGNMTRPPDHAGRALVPMRPAWCAGGD